MEKKDKPWKNDLKFNTSKLPNWPIKYYKPIPVKNHKPIPPGQPPVPMEVQEVSRLRAEVRQYSEYLSQSRSEAHQLKRELEVLKTKMADMVPKAKPKVPRSFSCDGRKFKDA